MRIGYTFAVFFALFFFTYALGFLLLPEGILKEIPMLVDLVFGETASFPSSVTRTIAMNGFTFVLIIAMNLFRVRAFTFGYLPLYANTALMGLFAGTNSFEGSVSTYTLAGWRLFFHIGFVEFSAYVFACTATVGLAIFHAEQWRGEKFQRVRRLRDVRLSGSELALLLSGMGLLVLAAFNEWRNFG